MPFPPGLAIIEPINGMYCLLEVEATGCGTCDMLPGLLEVAAAGCGARGMLPRNNEGVNVEGPTMDVVPGVGLARLRLERNSACVKLSGSGGSQVVATGVGGGLAGRGVPM